MASQPTWSLRSPHCPQGLSSWTTNGWAAGCSRFEAYGRAYLQQQLDLVVGAPGWRERLAATGASAVVLPTQAPLIDLLSADPSWRHVGQDVGYTLFVRR